MDTSDRILVEDLFSISELISVVEQTLLIPFEAPSGTENHSIERIGAWLKDVSTFSSDSHATQQQGENYWALLKAEFRLIVCTKDRKYVSLRKRLKGAANQSQLTMVSIISVGMAHQIGAAAGVLVPFCALCLIAFLRMGSEAFCNALDLNVPLL